MVVEQLGYELKFGFDVACAGGVACGGGTALKGGDGAQREPTDESVISHVESGRICIRTAVTNFGGHDINGDGQMEARGNFSGRNYTVVRGSMAVATVSQQRTLRDRFAIEVADGEDAVLMLAVILVIETIRATRRAAASGG